MHIPVASVQSIDEFFFVPGNPDMCAHLSAAERCCTVATTSMCYNTLHVAHRRALAAATVGSPLRSVWLLYWCWREVYGLLALQ